MSLALVAVATSDFDEIYGHVASHMPKYQNMHLREACQRGKRRELRYLHAIRVRPGPARVLDGMISGPDVLWRYELIRTRTRTQLNVLVDEASAKARDRIGARFLKEIKDRVDEEKRGFQYYPSLIPGQFYLRRWLPGMPASHPNCARAVAAGALDRRFVSQILPWGFRLLCP